MDFAAVRVQLDLRLRAMRAGTEPSASPEAVALATQAVDVGSQALILAAAEALGLVDATVAETPVAEEPSAPAPEPPTAS